MDAAQDEARRTEGRYFTDPGGATRFVLICGIAVEIGKEFGETMTIVKAALLAHLFPGHYSKN
jgi:hypothetical protein